MWVDPSSFHSSFELIGFCTVRCGDRNVFRENWEGTKPHSEVVPAAQYPIYWNLPDERFLARDPKDWSRGCAVSAAGEVRE